MLVMFVIPIGSVHPRRPQLLMGATSSSSSWMAISLRLKSGRPLSSDRWRPKLKVDSKARRNTLSRVGTPNIHYLHKVLAAHICLSASISPQPPPISRGAHHDIGHRHTLTNKRKFIRRPGQSVCVQPMCVRPILFKKRLKKQLDRA